jgi:hypothetical protein
MHLQDPAETIVILVTLAEPTPVAEAQGLQGDLEGAGIHPWAWVINNSIAATHPETVFLRQRSTGEIGQVNRVHSLAGRVTIVWDEVAAAEPADFSLHATLLMSTLQTRLAEERLEPRIL